MTLVSVFHLFASANGDEWLVMSDGEALPVARFASKDAALEWCRERALERDRAQLLLHARCAAGRRGGLRRIAAPARLNRRTRPTDR